MTARALTTPFASKITGTGSAYPSRRLTNEDLAKMVETNDEWIRERTGVVERRIADRNNEAERNSSMAAKAAMQALEMAGKKPEDIDAIFYATCTPDTMIPSASCWLQAKLGAKNAWGVDMNAACSGFVFALSSADQFIRTGQIKTALVVGSDVLSAYTNWEDRGSCILFGDGAGAMIVESVPNDSPNRILSSHMRIDGTCWEMFYMEAGGSNMEVTPEVHAKKLDKMNMKGKEIFKVAVKTLAEFAEKALTENGLGTNDLDWFIPHQANLRIIEGAAKRLDFPMERVIVNIDRYGNTSAATVPTAFDEAVRNGKIKRGQTVLFDVFGAGLTFGSMLIRF
jgi:3-oxoacyl-[acyl-carrier-protein] synthase-3